MGKVSNKARYLQLMEWLPLVKKSVSSKQANHKESRLSYYKKKNA